MSDDNKLPFDMLEGFAFMIWMWKTYPHELIEFAQEYHAEKQGGPQHCEGSK